MTEERVVEWASAEDLGADEGYEDIVLPERGRKVRVRYLDTAETTRLALLPDFLGFFALVATLNEDSEAGREGANTLAEGANTADLAAQEILYEAHVAHLAIVRPSYPEPEQPCGSCGAQHPPALWTLRQARRLAKADLDAVVEAALRAREVRALRPFSGDPTPSGSSEPATTSA